MIELTIPNYGLCYLGKDVILCSETDGEIDETNAGISFFTELLPKAVPRVVWNEVKGYETEKIILLDHILNNFDRHKGNIFFDLKTLIDFISFRIENLDKICEMIISERRK